MNQVQIKLKIRRLKKQLKHLETIRDRRIRRLRELENYCEQGTPIRKLVIRSQYLIIRGQYIDRLNEIEIIISNKQEEVMELQNLVG